MSHLRPLTIDVLLRNVTMRLPFRFGIHTMTEAPLCLIHLRAEGPDGRRVSGWSSDLLVPRWFEKTPGQSLAEDWTRLLSGIEVARDAALDPGTNGVASVFDHWIRVYESCVRADRPGETRFDRLWRGLGPSLIERAMIDAACRLAERPFAQMTGELGYDPTRCASWSPHETPPHQPFEAPLRAVRLRHTVGMLDPLSAMDCAVSERPEDGLPVTLEEILAATGVRFLKVKLSGDLHADVDRLRAIASVVSSVTDPASMGITFDGNEQYPSLDPLVELGDVLRSDAVTAPMANSVRWIEQPLPRASTFDPVANAAMSTLQAWAPCIIDEADVDVAAFGDALALGYRGVSTKNCKGVFRAFLNRDRARSVGGIQTAEDLTNLGVIGLQQDLATVSVLGIGDVERNGHHYAHGLDHLPASEQEAALREHPDLYEANGSSVSLRIESGTVHLGSILDSDGYAHRGVVDQDEWIDLESWTPASILGDEESVSGAGP